MLITVNHCGKRRSANKKTTYAVCFNKNKMKCAMLWQKGASYISVMHYNEKSSQNYGSTNIPLSHIDPNI